MRRLAAQIDPEFCLPDVSRTPVVAAVGFSRPKPGKTASHVRCFLCNGRGHRRADCPQNRGDRVPQKGGAPVKGSFKPGRYRGSARVANVDVEVASDGDESFSDEELRSGNDRA